MQNNIYVFKFRVRYTFAIKKLIFQFNSFSTIELNSKLIRKKLTFKHLMYAS